MFNTTTIIPDFDITIDEMLVYLPQLNRQCEVLSKMRDAMTKVRVSSGYSGGNIIDYKYANYDIEEVGRHYGWRVKSQEPTNAEYVPNDWLW